MAATETALINGPDGPIELIIDTPQHVRGIALICHPHPLFHGSNTNKVPTPWPACFATWATRRCGEVAFHLEAHHGVLLLLVVGVAPPAVEGWCADAGGVDVGRVLVVAGFARDLPQPVDA